MLIADIGMIMVVHLLGCISPGPDFVLVVRNTLVYNRSAAMYTVLGIATGILMHTTYCALGLGVVLLASPHLFQCLRVLGALYLLYLGAKIFLSQEIVPVFHEHTHHKAISAWKAFRTGFFTNALNPKAMLFILGLFIMVTKAHNPWWSAFFVVEMTLVTGLWFSFLVYCFSHPKLKARLTAIQGRIGKVLAVFLWGFALQLIFGA